MKQFSIRIVGAQARDSNRRLPNRSQKRYRLSQLPLRKEMICFHQITIENSTGNDEHRRTDTVTQS
jgi:hypothetical protein